MSNVWYSRKSNGSIAWKHFIIHADRKSNNHVIYIIIPEAHRYFKIYDTYLASLHCLISCKNLCILKVKKKRLNKAIIFYSSKISAFAMHFFFTRFAFVN